MGMLETLLSRGAVPKGTTPMVSPAPGVDPGFLGGQDGMSSLMRNLMVMSAQQKSQQEEDLKKAEKKMDMYKTLRDSGYDPGRAFKAVSKMEFPTDPGGETAAEKKAALDGEKTKAETDKIRKETATMTFPKKTLEATILNKIASGEKLTSGEEKIYNDVIKKKGGSTLEDILAGQQEQSPPPADAGTEAAPVDFVPMVDPKGVKKKVHPDDVAKALKKGWKKR